MRRVVKLFLLTFLFSFYISAQPQIYGITAEQKLKTLLNNKYEHGKSILPGNKLMSSLEHYKITGDSEVLYAKNNYIYSSGKLTEMLFETDLTKPNTDKQKYVLKYTENDHIEFVEYQSPLNDAWETSSKVKYTVDETGFGDSVISFNYSADTKEWQIYSFVTFTKSKDGKVIETVGTYYVDDYGMTELIKTFTHLDDYGRPTKYEYFEYSVPNKQWVHKYNYEYVYTDHDIMKLEYLKSFVTGSEFKTEYFINPNKTIDHTEWSQLEGNSWKIFSKNLYGYNNQGHISSIIYGELVNGSFVDKSKYNYVTDSYGNIESVDMYYINFGILELKERNKFFFEVVTEVEENPMSDEKTFTLSNNYPNPFNPVTVINYQLSTVSNVRLSVYDLLGREIMTLVNEIKPAGAYSVSVDGKDLTSGVYIYQIQVGNQIQTKKMMLVK